MGSSSEGEARELAGKHFDQLTEQGYASGSFDFRREYPSRGAYVEEWWEERYLSSAAPVTPPTHQLTVDRCCRDCPPERTVCFLCREELLNYHEARYSSEAPRVEIAEPVYGFPVFVEVTPRQGGQLRLTARDAKKLASRLYEAALEIQRQRQGVTRS